MKLHHLSMTAIGPFAGEVRIDFSQLGEKGLFLLEGPTGSGKSTVIDAISFALYGRVAQASADNERLRSHHAAADVVPMVELIFETQSGIYRVRRTPSYLRPKRSGAGETKQQGTIKLWRLPSPHDHVVGEPLSTRFSEADDEIRRAIGLNHSQFVQTVVLPQGEFATFLQSDTDSKRSLLQKLFGTELIARTQARLIDGRRDAVERRAAAARSVDNAVHAFVAGAGLDADQAAIITSADPDTAQGMAREQVDALTAFEKGATRAHKRSASVLRAARAAHDAAAELASRRARRHALRERAAALATDEPLHTAMRAELDSAERAGQVVPFARSLQTALTALDEAIQHDAAARARVRPDLARADEAELRTAADLHRTTMGELAEAARLESELPAMRDDHARTVASVSELDAAISELRSQLSAHPATADALRSERDIALAHAAQRGVVKAEHQRAISRLGVARHAVEAERIAVHEEQITLAALQELDAQNQRLTMLRATRTASIAAELGLALQVGDPCQVCGSVEHPRPAQRGANYVGKEELESAESELTRLTRRADDARRHLEQQRERLIELKTAADQLSPEAAQDRLDAVAERLCIAEQATARLPELDAEIARLAAAAESLSDKIHHAEVAVATLTQQRASLADRITAGTAVVDSARNGFPSVAEYIGALRHEATDLAAAYSAAAALAAARTAEAELAAQFSAALSEAGFDSVAQWQSATRSVEQAAELRQSLEAVADEWAAVRSGLAEPALTDAALDEDPADLDVLGADVQLAEAAAAEASEAFVSARNRRTSAARHADKLSAAIAAGRAVLLETAAAIRLGNLVSGNGDNQLKMELTTYVLVRRFAEVISSANTQLRRISGGRYELEHTDSRSGNARSGLGLLVHDLHTGKPRDPKTLSGGETFYVSLSLALGLADVVRSESGGIDLGTLFIDEGFGSLDAEILDGVIAMLDSLRAGGRSVGIVSHVAELKARIFDRIEVSRTDDGSSRLKVVA